jgi:hypothetical protein
MSVKVRLMAGFTQHSQSPSPSSGSFCALFWSVGEDRGSTSGEPGFDLKPCRADWFSSYGDQHGPSYAAPEIYEFVHLSVFVIHTGVIVFVLLAGELVSIFSGIDARGSLTTSAVHVPVLVIRTMGKHLKIVSL